MQAWRFQHRWFNTGLGFQRRCFPVKFAKFLRTPILKNICGRMLLLWKKRSTQRWTHETSLRRKVCLCRARWIIILYPPFLWSIKTTLVDLSYTNSSDITENSAAIISSGIEQLYILALFTWYYNYSSLKRPLDLFNLFH